jgi:hypothetical protein
MALFMAADDPLPLIAPSWFGGDASRLPEKVAYLVKEEGCGSCR